MTEEILLTLKNAEHMSRQQRSLRNQRLRIQRTTNLTDGLLPYIISDGNKTDVDSSSYEIPYSSEQLFESDQSPDIDYDLISPDYYVEHSKIDALEQDQTAMEDSESVLNELFSSKTVSNTVPLHSYTNISTNEFCINLLRTFRRANLCKTYSSDILKLIHSALPQPNTLPNSMNSILKFIQVENIFNKRIVCLVCQSDIGYTARSCDKCVRKHLADIHEINFQLVFPEIVDRHLINIVNYREKIFDDTYQDINNDIPFQHVYRSFLKTNPEHPFITGLLHLDGIPLAKSNKQTLWVLSCSILELPPQIRNERKNMTVLSLWVADCQPIITIWLKEFISRLKHFKSTGFTTSTANRWYIYFLGIIADCPAMKLALNHIGNNGYFSCWLCKIESIHVGRKRQYYFEETPQMRDVYSYRKESNEAEVKRMNVNGHLGISVLHDLLDIPLPNSIVLDYMHITLLRHTRGIVTQMFNHLKPSERIEIDDRLQFQAFPHTFNRKLKPISVGNVKASELRNLLFYGLLPIFYSYLPINKAGHVALFVCAVRMLHGNSRFGNRTGTLAHELITIFYKDHHKFYDGLNNLVLHLHIHYTSQYKNFGSLNNTNCFSQESFLGAFAKNKHGTRGWADLLAHYFNIDFALQKQIYKQNIDNHKLSDGAFDISTILTNDVEGLSSWHREMCCNETRTCITLYNRCSIRNQIYHPKAYSKRQSTNSYFVQYTNDHEDELFGSILNFYTHKGLSYAVVHNHSNVKRFSDALVSSIYHSILIKSINSYFFVLETHGSSFHFIEIQRIMNMCVVFQQKDFIIVTPISNVYEHD